MEIGQLGRRIDYSISITKIICKPSLQSTEPTETEETVAVDPGAEIQQEENDNDSISSADTVNSVQRVQSV